MEGYVCCANVCICFLLFRCHVGYHKRETTSSIDIDIKRLKKWSPPHKRIFGRIQFSPEALFCRFFCSLSPFLSSHLPLFRLIWFFDRFFFSVAHRLRTILMRHQFDWLFFNNINNVYYWCSSTGKIRFVVDIFQSQHEKKERIKDLVGRRAQKKRRLNKRKSLSS